MNVDVVVLLFFENFSNLVTFLSLHVFNGSFIEMVNIFPRKKTPLEKKMKWKLISYLVIIYRSHVWLPNYLNILLLGTLEKIAS